MTIEEAIEKLNVLSSYETAPEKRKAYKKCINTIIFELRILRLQIDFVNTINNKYSELVTKLFETINKKEF